MPGPGPVAEDDDRRTPWLVVRRCERAPERSADAEDVEEVPCDERALHPAAFDQGLAVLACKCIGEHARLAEERFILRARVGFLLRVGGFLTFDREQFVRRAHLIHLKDLRVEDGEDASDKAQAEPDGRHDGQGHEGRPEEQPPGVSDVSGGAVQLNPHLLAHGAPRDGAEGPKVHSGEDKIGS